MAWVKANPGKYKLSVHTSRYDPPPTEDVWTHDAEGHVLNGQAKSYDGTTWTPDMRGVISPEAPDFYWIEAGKGRAKCIAEIQNLAPVAMVINSGEWGLGLWGQFANVWKKDPKIQNAISANELLSRAKPSATPAICWYSLPMSFDTGQARGDRLRHLELVHLRCGFLDGLSHPQDQFVQVKWFPHQPKRSSFKEISGQKITGARYQEHRHVGVDFQSGNRFLERSNATRIPQLNGGA